MEGHAATYRQPYAPYKVDDPAQQITAGTLAKQNRVGCRMSRVSQRLAGIKPGQSEPILGMLVLMWMQHEFNEDSDEGRYFFACARIRNISPTGLMKRLVAEIVKDQMVASILDDTDELRQRRPREHRSRI